MLLELRNVFLTENESLTAEYKLDLHELDFNGEKPLKSPVRVMATAANQAGVVNLAVSAQFDYTAPCDRCGEETITEFAYSFQHTLVQSLVGENDGDYVEVPDYQLDLDELVTMDIVLELPHKHLCSDDCKGLCPKCGHNLNMGDCGCDTRQVDPRLEALRSLLQ